MKLDDKELEIDKYSETCIRCVHLHRDYEGRKCDAFNNIPLVIWNGHNDHKKPFKGDNGIQFEAIDE